MNTLSKADPWDLVADGYDTSARYVFLEYAAAALELVDIQQGHTVADIACGPGTLTTLLAKRAAQIAAIDFSERMLKILERDMSDENLGNVSTHHADGQALPFADDHFDAAFSLFGLMFFPNRAEGYAEMFRTLRPGGTACVSSWSKLSDSSLFDVMARSMGSLDPSQTPPNYDINSLENPDVLKSEMLSAGFQDVVIHRVERYFEFASAEELWRGLAEGSAPISLMKSRLPKDLWDAHSARALQFLRSTAGPFPTRLGTTAWLGLGRKPLDDTHPQITTDKEWK